MIYCLADLLRLFYCPGIAAEELNEKLFLKKRTLLLDLLIRWGNRFYAFFEQMGKQTADTEIFNWTAEGTRETIARKDKQRNPDSIDCLKPRSRASPSFYMILLIMRSTKPEIGEWIESIAFLSWIAGRTRKILVLNCRDTKALNPSFDEFIIEASER